MNSKPSVVIHTNPTCKPAVHVLDKNNLDQQLRENGLRKRMGKTGYHNDHTRESEDTSRKPFTNIPYQYAVVDRFFLILSPFLFIIFNTIYWGYFLHWTWVVKNAMQEDWHCDKWLFFVFVFVILCYHGWSRRHKQWWPWLNNNHAIHLPKYPREWSDRDRGSVGGALRIGWTNMCFCFCVLLCVGKQ